jgi:hypothetical protein
MPFRQTEWPNPLPPRRIGSTLDWLWSLLPLGNPRLTPSRRYTMLAPLLNYFVRAPAVPYAVRAPAAPYARRDDGE